MMFGGSKKQQVSENDPVTYAEGEDFIHIENLSKIYKRDDSETVAIEDFNINIKRGELISIVGPSGCGKTTILRMIAGLLEPTSGVITVAGHPCDKPGPDRGMVFQDFALMPWRSVIKNVELGMEMAGVPKEERRKKGRKHTYLPNKDDHSLRLLRPYRRTDSRT